jgi:hypothetical protein
MSISAEKNDYVSKQKNEWLDAGYDISPGSSIEWEMFYQEHLTDNFDSHNLEFCLNKKHKWWIAKIMPGKCFPMHRDSFDLSDGKISRYWMALDDHKFGHVFILEDQILQDYKKGDVFKFSDELHGAANVGTEPKLSMQIVVIE